MIQAGASGIGGGWAGVPYSPTRLYTTIVVMLVAVTLAVLVVRARVANRLLAEIARTLASEIPVAPATASYVKLSNRPKMLRQTALTAAALFAANLLLAAKGNHVAVWPGR